MYIYNRDAKRMAHDVEDAFINILCEYKSIYIYVCICIYAYTLVYVYVYIYVYVHV